MDWTSGGCFGIRAERLSSPHGIERLLLEVYFFFREGGMQKSYCELLEQLPNPDQRSDATNMTFTVQLPFDIYKGWPQMVLELHGASHDVVLTTSHGHLLLEMKGLVYLNGLSLGKRTRAYRYGYNLLHNLSERRLGSYGYYMD